jgi:hypothetical protein
MKKIKYFDEKREKNANCGRGKRGEKFSSRFVESKKDFSSVALRRWMFP